MASVDRSRERELFDQCLQIPEEEREGHVRRVCGADSELAERVLRLLSAYGKAEEAVFVPANAFASLLEDPTQIGGYRIIKRLGEGGMGVVYEAEQDRPVRRRVALKVIKAGMDTREVVARFEAERQALAVMDHPSIAKVFDAGVTAAGTPYFAMELVQGTPLVQFCDENQLSTRNRLEIFRDLCQAVQHAHQKGVIHRDLKPSNVLVTVHDGQALPKVIDFGIAKAVGTRLTDSTLMTLHGQPIGTPAYMSPEQAEFSGLDVDARTDVYSLGVTLYELLVAALPLDPVAMGLPAFLAALARRETTPPRPSAKFESLGDRRDGVAQKRLTDPRTLKKQLQGDLDWIVMKAMEAERSRRYETPSALSEDISRFLDHKPVVARPPSAAYRLGKFVRRHRAAAVAVSVATTFLLAGTIGTTIGLIRATQAEVKASQEALAARQVSDFLVSLFELADPGQTRGESITARELLDQGTVRINEKLMDQPVVHARLLATMGRVYRALGLYRQSEDLARRALQIEQQTLPSDSPALASTLSDLGAALIRLGRLDEADELLSRALEIREAQFEENPLGLADALTALGGLRWQLGQYRQARHMHERARQIRVRQLGPKHLEVGNSLRNLGIVAQSLDQPEEALRLHQQAQAIFERELGADHPLLADNLDSLGLGHAALGELREARTYHQRALEIRRRVLGSDHPVIAYSLLNVARVEADSGEVETARALYLEGLRIREASLGAEHPKTADLLESLAILEAQSGNLEESQRLFERSLSIYRKAYGPSNPETLESLRNLALLLTMRGRHQAALKCLRQAVEGGYAPHMKLDEADFDPLRGLPEFKKIEEEVRRRLPKTEASD